MRKNFIDKIKKNLKNMIIFSYLIYLKNLEPYIKIQFFIT